MAIDWLNTQNVHPPPQIKIKSPHHEFQTVICSHKQTIILPKFKTEKSKVSFRLNHGHGFHRSCNFYLQQDSQFNTKFWITFCDKPNSFFIIHHHQTEIHTARIPPKLWSWDRRLFRNDEGWKQVRLSCAKLR